MPLNMIQIRFQLSNGSSLPATTSLSVSRSGTTGSLTLCLPTGEVRVMQRALISELAIGLGNKEGIETITIRGIDGLRSLHHKICALVGESDDGWVPVKKMGKGTTDKSCKVHVEDVIYKKYDSGDVVKSHTLTVPVSQVREHGGQLFAPRWMLKKQSWNAF